MQLLTAIIFCSKAQVNGNTVLKYRNIEDTPVKIASFMAFAARFPGAMYVNFYYKRLPHEKNGRYKERIYLQ